MDTNDGDKESMPDDGVVSPGATPPTADVIPSAGESQRVEGDVPACQEDVALSSSEPVVKDNTQETEAAGAVGALLESSEPAIIDGEETTRSCAALSSTSTVASGNGEADKQSAATALVDESSPREAADGSVACSVPLTNETAMIPDPESSDGVVETVAPEEGGDPVVSENTALVNGTDQEPSLAVNVAQENVEQLDTPISEAEAADGAVETVAPVDEGDSVVSKSSALVNSTEQEPGLAVNVSQEHVGQLTTPACAIDEIPRKQLTVTLVDEESLEGRPGSSPDFFDGMSGEHNDIYVPDGLFSDNPSETLADAVYRNFTPSAPLVNGFLLGSPPRSRRRERKRPSSPPQPPAYSPPTTKASYIDADYALALRLQEEENRMAARAYTVSQSYTDHQYLPRRRTNSNETGSSSDILGPSNQVLPMEAYIQEEPMDTSTEQRAVGTAGDGLEDGSTQEKKPEAASVTETSAQKVSSESPTTTESVESSETEEEPMTKLAKIRLHSEFWECRAQDLNVHSPYMLYRLTEAGYIEGYMRTQNDRFFFENEEQLLKAMAPPDDPEVHRVGELNENDNVKDEMCNEMWRQYTHCVELGLAVPIPFTMPNNMSPFEYAKRYLVAGATGDFPGYVKPEKKKEDDDDDDDDDEDSESTESQSDGAKDTEGAKTEAGTETGPTTKLVLKIPADASVVDVAPAPLPPHRQTAAERKAAYQAALKEGRILDEGTKKEMYVDAPTAIQNLMMAADRITNDIEPLYIPTKPVRKVSRRYVEEFGELGPDSRRIQGLPDYDEYFEDDPDGGVAAMAAAAAQGNNFAVPNRPSSARIHTSPVSTGRFNKVPLFDINRKRVPTGRSPSRERFGNSVERLAIPMKSAITPPSSFKRRCLYSDEIVKKHPFMKNIDRAALDMIEHTSRGGGGGQNHVSSTTTEIDPSLPKIRWLDPEHMPRVNMIPAEELKKMPQEYIDEINKETARKDALPPPPPPRTDKFSVQADKEEREEKQLYESTYLELVRNYIPCNTTVPDAIFDTRFEVFVRFPFLERPLYVQNVLTALNVPDNGGNVRMELHEDYRNLSCAESMKFGVQARQGLIFQGEDIDNISTGTITHDRVLSAREEFRKEVLSKLETDADRQPIEGEQRVLAHSLIPPYITLLRLYPLSKEDIYEMQIQRRDWIELQEMRERRQRAIEARQARAAARAARRDALAHCASRSPSAERESSSRTQTRNRSRSRSRTRRSESRSRSPRALQDLPVDEHIFYERVDIDSDNEPIDNVSIGSVDLEMQYMSDEDLATALRLSREETGIVVSDSDEPVQYDGVFQFEDLPPDVPGPSRRH